MSIKHEIDKTARDLKDATSEAFHRTAAEAEKARRDAEGEEMTSGEKLESMANEAKHRTQAGVDSAKRSVRDNT